MAKTQSRHCGAKSENNKVLKVTADFDVLIRNEQKIKYENELPVGGRTCDEIARMNGTSTTTALVLMRRLVKAGKARMVQVKPPGQRFIKTYIVPA